VVYPALVDINPVPEPTDKNRWDEVALNTDAWNNAYRRSSSNGDPTSYLEWRVPIGAGTWKLAVTYVGTPDAGIMTFLLDGTPIGTVDGYKASTTFNAEDTIGGIHVPTSGLHTLRVETSTQNPASTNYYGYLVWLRLIQ
jgi:hypothetical protein